MRAARHAAIAVMALTASAHAAAQDVGTFNPNAPGNIYSLDALEVPISPVVAPAVVPFDTAIEVPLPRPRPPLRDTVGENPVVLISAFRQQHGEGPVAISGMLTRIAQEQANAMAARDLLDHDLLAPFAHRMGRSRFKRGAENIAFGHADFAGTLKAVDQFLRPSRQSVAARCKVDRRCPRLKCPPNLLGNGDRRGLTYSEILEFTNVRLYPLRHSRIARKSSPKPRSQSCGDRCKGNGSPCRPNFDGPK